MRSEIGHVREVSPGVWVVQVSGGLNPVTGKRVRRSKTVHGTRRTAEQTKNRMLAEVGQADAGSMTLTDFFEGMYLPRLRARVKAGQMRVRTVDEYEAKWKLYVKPHLGDLRLVSLSKRIYVLEDWLTALAGSGIGGRTQLHAYRIVKTALRKAVLWQLLTSNPLECIPKPDPGEYAAAVLDLNAAREYLDAFRGHELEPIVALAIDGGFRRSELAAMSYNDVRFWTEELEDGSRVRLSEVTVSRSRHERAGEVWFEAPKTRGSKRTVPLTSWTTDILWERRQAGLICGELTPNQISYRYKKRIDAAGLTYVPLKNLRHSSATIAFELGAELKAVSERLGHSVITTTDTFYLKPGRESGARVAFRMEAIVPRPEKKRRRAR